MDQITKSVCYWLMKYARVKKTDLKLDSRLTDDLGLDSMDISEIINWVETVFKIELTGPECAKIISFTVRDFCRMIRGKLEVGK